MTFEKPLKARHFSNWIVLLMRSFDKFNTSIVPARKANGHPINLAVMLPWAIVLLFTRNLKMLSEQCANYPYIIINLTRHYRLIECRDRYQRILQNINFHVFMIWLTKRSWVLSESASKFASTSQADCQLQMPTWTVLLPSKTFFQSIHLWLVCLIKLIVFYHYLAISDFLIIHLHIRAIFWSSICLFIPVSSQFLW